MCGSGMATKVALFMNKTMDYLDCNPDNLGTISKNHPDNVERMPVLGSQILTSKIDQM